MTERAGHRRRVICGVDDSERTYEAVSVAWDVAKQAELGLMLVHVVDEPAAFPFGEPAVMERERQQRRARGAVLLRDIALTFDLPPDTELRSESGDPAAILRTVADEESAALLVVASRGRGRIRSALFGSVTAELVDGLGCPMLVVPPGAATHYRRAAVQHDATVVCGVDASSAVDVLVPPADEIAAALHAQLLILHADLPPMTASGGSSATAGVSMAGVPVALHEDVDDHRDAAREQLDRATRLATRTAEVDARVELSDLAVTMSRLAEERSIQMLAIAADSPWQRLAARAGCPVLVVPLTAARAETPPRGR